MKAKDLFIIILKVFGIYLIKDVLTAIPPVLNSFFQMFEVSGAMAFFSLIISLLYLGIYVGIVYLLLFKTSLLVSKLKLASELSDEPLVVNLHRSSVYTIAIIITGLLVLTFSIPDLVKQIYFFYEFNDSRKRLFAPSPFDYSRMIIAITEVIIGLLFLGNQRTLVNYIESKRRRAKEESDE
ncbi:hypothetical protein [Lacibacter sp.]|uniref:hypothetical protein n=1 Tax=Lacibacter sp. TaxID=1915409 RepID=UPI002B4B2771|nr:hypothetical protein [Lacibacter sp.]HLP39823.1 hypothetical protein [Lacibacter sp.]